MLSHIKTSYRTHSCGELNKGNSGIEVILCGWVQRVRELGGMKFVDLRDRYGITQLVFHSSENGQLFSEAGLLSREDVIQASGIVAERSNKNPQLPTGEIEIEVTTLKVIRKSKTPPFTIEEESDGGEELRMKYRYLDLRRSPLQKNIILRHNMAKATREYLDSLGFLEIETPCLIKSTPEGARDFVVPSRMNAGQFYALPQSPQTFKQLLMVAGYDRYFQIVRCFRDEDLRSDRQPEFTQVDCEMAFVKREDIMNTFEGLVRHLFKSVLSVEIADLPVLTYDEAMSKYGSDKPDLRFGMEFKDITSIVKGKGFGVFDQAEAILGIRLENCAGYSRKEIDEITEIVKQPQLGGKGLVYVKYNSDGSIKSSVDKFYDATELSKWAEVFGAGKGDLLLIVSGSLKDSRRVLGQLRLEMANRLGLKKGTSFSPLWVVDFPLLEWNEEGGRFFAMHHPFTSPADASLALLDTDPAAAKANAYDLVINGVEIGGGSIRIHDASLQQKMFSILGFTGEEAMDQFGFLVNSFNFGAPPHGGIAFGFDRLCAVFGGSDLIRDFIAFPKNNAGRDVMLDAPSQLSGLQLKELNLSINPDVKK